MLMYKKIEWYCIVCDRTIDIKPKRKLLERVTFNELENSLRIKHTSQNPDFFKKNNNVFTTHKKISKYISFKMTLYNFLIKNLLLMLIVNNNHFQKCFISKIFFHLFEYLPVREHKFSHTFQSNVTTINAIRSMTFEIHPKNPIQKISYFMEKT